VIYDKGYLDYLVQKTS